MLIACADIGSVPQGNFAWAAWPGSTGTRPSELATYVATSLNSGESVALGFECPLFVPLPASEWELGKGRAGEGSRPWSAGAGAGSLATGIAQVAWVLSRARSLLTVPPRGHLLWDEFCASPPGSLLIWEAFVSSSDKGANHAEDARLALETFISVLPAPATASAIPATCPVHSLAGAALLRAGWSSDLSLLAQSCIVIRAGANAA